MRSRTAASCGLHRTTGSGWSLHDGDHATLHDARAYVESLTNLTSTTGPRKS
jgi:hypothetical protein